MYPSDKEKTTITLQYWQPYPKEKWYQDRGLNVHFGVDIAPYAAFVNEEIPIYAAVDGLISAIYFSKSYGNIIKQLSSSSDKGREHRYAHLKRSVVKKGDVVKKGQLIAIMGSTGYCFGNPKGANPKGIHCHYEVRKMKNGKLVPVDPNPYLT